MKKHMPGFVPANFQLVGKIILAIGLAIFVYSILTQNYQTSTYPLALGVLLLFVGIYLIKFVPKE